MFFQQQQTAAEQVLAAQHAKPAKFEPAEFEPPKFESAEFESAEFESAEFESAEFEPPVQFATWFPGSTGQSRQPAAQRLAGFTDGAVWRGNDAATAFRPG